MPAFTPAMPEIDDYRRLFLEDIPLLDVRAPIEFHDGAFPHATNAPLIDDAERHRIGIEYKQQGQDAAIALGEGLVSGQHKQHRVTQWCRFVAEHPHGALYCFRGGMRSRITQQWINDANGVAYPRVKGGYKALRRFLLNELEIAATELHPVVLGGKTGCGKTRFLHSVTPMLDLEGLANHRGSAFGNHASAQPSPIDFENAVAIALLKHRAAGNQPILIEDESRNIGARHLPERLYERLQLADLVILDEPLERRVDITLQEYVHDALAEYTDLYGAEVGFENWATYLNTSLDRIRRRLGGVRHQQIGNQLRDALDAQRESGDCERHRIWIAALLGDYYDSMYTYQIENKSDRIVFRGDAEAVREFLQTAYAIS